MTHSSHIFECATRVQLIEQWETSVQNLQRSLNSPTAIALGMEERVTMVLLIEDVERALAELRDEVDVLGDIKIPPLLRDVGPLLVLGVV